MRKSTEVVETLLREYATWMRSWDASDRTVRARVAFGRARLRDWGGLAGFTTEAATNFMASLVEEERSEWTMSTYYTHLSSFGEWLATTGRLAVDPVSEMRRPTSPKSEPRPLSDTDLNRVLDTATGEVLDWVMLALHSGLRSHEIAKIHGQDVQVEGLYVKGKGKKKVTLPCHPVVWEMAQRYPRDGYWFPGQDHGHLRSQQVSNTVGQFFTVLGIEGGIHRVRHSYCTRLLRSGVHIRKVQELMRHSSLATTAGYSAVDEDELRDAILQLPTIIIRSQPSLALVKSTPEPA